MPLQTVGSARIANNSISTDKLANNSVTTEKLVDYSVTAGKFANNVFSIYDLDDISYLTDGVTNIFPLTYNTANVSVVSPWNLMVSVSGLMQAAYANTIETFWMSHVASAPKGYTLNDSGQILFADPVPAGADVMIRLMPGAPAQNTKIYPFRPTDIFMGY